LVLCVTLGTASAFTCLPSLPRHKAGIAPYASLPRRNAGEAIALAAGAAFNLPDWLGGGGATAAVAGGNTNDIIKTVAGIRQRRLGGGSIVVSELGLGTQRWGGADYNSPDEALCHQMLDFAVANGVNLVDTAEQYPIPSDLTRPEGRTEEIIGNWLAQDKSRREKLVIATKITGGSNITPNNIIQACEGSLKRLQTDYIDVYNLHWPARYTPQSNWGQSLEYNHPAERAPYYRGHASFDEIVSTMGKLIQDGKIRGYGACNDNAVGLMGMAAAAKRLGVPGPCTMQGDYSMVNRRSEENGLSEASSSEIENCGWMGYNILAGGVLTNKYYADGVAPPAVDDPERLRAQASAKNPRGRMDTAGWGNTLYRYRTYAVEEATRDYAKVAKSNKLSLTEMAQRWAAGRQFCTTSLVGHTTMRQLEESISAYRAAAKGPLPEQVLWDIDRIHMRNRLPLFASDRVGRDWSQEGEIGERIP